jgi:hypothetical protein
VSNLLTQSRLRTYRDCSRKHAIAYIEGFRPAVDAEALHVGTLVHKGLAAWWRAPADARLTPALDAVDARARDPFSQVLVEELLRAYDSRWGGDSAYEALLVEESFTAPLINPETGAASRTWLLAGQVDVIVREVATGRVLLMEHKTTGDAIDHDATDYFLKLCMDGQISHYVIGAEALGHEVEACVYDVIRKPGQRPLRATPVESRKYTAKGTLYAAQREHDEQPEEYRLRIRESLADHATMLRRREVPRIERQIADYLGDVWQYAQQMRADELAARSTRNPEACDRFGRCAYWDLCATGMKPEEHPEAYVRLADVHPELEVKQQQGEEPGKVRA